ncbi:hypothetical protein LCGC14_1312340 [marine sediment metagenome]|uniref:Uncharacterized protein n=1 Tax=marine sediment metagenome TaxID=412755 RepID=A0A0F9L6Z9_9ZZZZ
MENTPVIKIDTDKPCKRCYKKGAVQPSGCCMSCILKMLESGEIKLPKINPKNSIG